MFKILFRSCKRHVMIRRCPGGRSAVRQIKVIWRTTGIFIFSRILKNWSIMFMFCCFCSKIVFKVVFRICKLQEVWFGFVCSCCFPLVLMNCSRILCFLDFYVFVIFRAVSKNMFNKFSSCLRFLHFSSCFLKQFSIIFQEF